MSGEPLYGEAREVGATPHLVHLTTFSHFKPAGSGQTLIVTVSALEATQGQRDGLLIQLPFTCHLDEVASVGD